ncbi:hypothetical protein FKW77_000181 [Venturia effusa]|uniref:Ig-like domain-containing protein n=1 Tax=Venturia effusa TaxID=50376 RepID=A0A517LHU7_9PEZI|nr:hypothetical protein FKW77_000181 [Venturia effusa]
MISTIVTLFLSTKLIQAEKAFGPAGGGFGGHGGLPGGFGGWGGMMPWGDNEWNWGGHGRSGAPKAIALPDACPPGAPPPGFVAPFQPLFNQHFENSPVGEHWEQMCPRDRSHNDLYIPVKCGTERKGCCTWRATATKLPNNVWACCPCGASCTGVAPGFGYDWTESQPVPTPVGWTAVGNQLSLTPPGPPQPYTTTFLANGGTSISTIFPGPPVSQTPYPGALPYSAPGAVPTAYTTFFNGVPTTVTGFTQPTCAPGAFCPLPQYPNGQVIGPLGANGQGSWTWTSATTKNGKTYQASWVHVTGTKTVPVSICDVNNGKTNCHVLSTTAVGCSLRNGNQVCSTSKGVVVQTVNAAPTNVAGVGAGVVAAALGFAYALA